VVWAYFGAKKNYPFGRTNYSPRHSDPLGVDAVVHLFEAQTTLNNRHISVPVECRFSNVIAESVRAVSRGPGLGKWRGGEDGAMDPLLVPE